MEFHSCSLENLSACETSFMLTRLFVDMQSSLFIFLLQQHDWTPLKHPYIVHVFLELLLESSLMQSVGWELDPPETEFHFFQTY